MFHLLEKNIQISKHNSKVTHSKIQRVVREQDPELKLNQTISYFYMGHSEPSLGGNMLWEYIELWPQGLCCWPTIKAKFTKPTMKKEDLEKKKDCGKYITNIVNHVKI